MGSECAPTTRDYQSFGWHGIRLTVPSGWDLVRAEGDRRAGYVQLADEVRLRLEMRWREGRKAASASHPVEAYLARLNKEAGKRGAAASAQRHLNLASPPGKEVECYRWLADGQVLGMSSRCTDCGRLVHVQVLGQSDEPLKGLARTVFSSLCDHAEGGTQLWSFLDVEFSSPAGLPLVGKGLQSGCVRMRFGRRRTRLEFVRVSLAEVLLARKELGAWFREFYGRSLRRRRFSTRPTTVKGHEAVEAEGRPWRLVNPLALLGRRRIVRAACWHCPASNRLFICCFDGPQRESHIFQPALESFACCAAA